MALLLYSFTGTESGEKADAINTLRAKHQKKYGEIENHVFYSSETPFADVISLLLNGSLFSPGRFVVFNNAEVLKKKEEVELLSQWAKTEDDTSVLVLCSDENSIDKKIENIVPKENRRVFWEMFQDKKEQWLRSYFMREGYKIESDAVDAILELVENNTAELKRECARFFACFEKGHLITVDDVDQILSHNREESPFTLFDALATNAAPSTRLENALEILQKIRLSKDSNAVSLIAGLTFCFRRLLVWQKLKENGAVSQFDLKIKGFASKKAQDQYSRASRIWNIDDTNRILALLASSDISLRSGGQALEDTLLQMMLYSIVNKRGEEISEYVVD